MAPWVPGARSRRRRGGRPAKWVMRWTSEVGDWCRPSSEFITIWVLTITITETAGRAEGRYDTQQLWAPGPPCAPKNSESVHPALSHPSHAQLILSFLRPPYGRRAGADRDRLSIIMIFCVGNPSKARYMLPTDMRWNLNRHKSRHLGRTQNHHQRGHAW